MCFSFWFALIGFGVIVVIVIIWCIKQGYFKELGQKIVDVL